MEFEPKPELLLGQEKEPSKEQYVEKNICVISSPIPLVQMLFSQSQCEHAE